MTDYSFDNVQTIANDLPSGTVTKIALYEVDQNFSAADTIGLANGIPVPKNAVITEVTNLPQYKPKEGRTNATCREKLARVIGHLLNQRRIKQKRATEAGRITKEEIFELQQHYHKEYIIGYLGTVYSELEQEFKDILNKSDSYKLQRWVVRKSRAIEEYLKNYSDEKLVHEQALKLLEKSTVTSFTNRNNVLSTLVGICSKSHTYYVRSVQHKNTGYYAAGGDMFKQSKRRLPLTIAVTYFMTKRQLMQAAEEHKREEAARKRNKNVRRTTTKATRRERERNERNRPRLVNKNEEQFPIEAIEPHTFPKPKGIKEDNLLKTLGEKDDNIFNGLDRVEKEVKDNE